MLCALSRSGVEAVEAIWTEPSASYARKAAEMRQIRSELEMWSSRSALARFAVYRYRASKI